MSEVLSPLQSELYQAIEHLYATFQIYPLKPDIQGCPCCVATAAQQSLQKPLRKLSAADLEHYAFKALTTWGDENDFRHFLPRIFELVSTGFDVDVEIIFGKLRYAEWHTWPDVERQAIQRYGLAMWNIIISDNTTYSLDEWVLCASITLDSFGSVLNDWRSIEVADRQRSLAEFINGNAATLIKKNRLRNAFWNQYIVEHGFLIRWLKERQTLEALERAFFLCEDEPCAAEISKAVEVLKVLSNEEKRK